MPNGEFKTFLPLLRLKSKSVPNMWNNNILYRNQAHTCVGAMYVETYASDVLQVKHSKKKKKTIYSSVRFEDLKYATSHMMRIATSIRSIKYVKRKPLLIISLVLKIRITNNSKSRNIHDPINATPALQFTPYPVHKQHPFLDYDKSAQRCAMPITSYLFQRFSGYSPAAVFCLMASTTTGRSSL